VVIAVHWKMVLWEEMQISRFGWRHIVFGFAGQIICRYFRG
jgi:hypothetical protein